MSIELERSLDLLQAFLPLIYTFPSSSCHSPRPLAKQTQTRAPRQQRVRLVIPKPRYHVKSCFSMECEEHALPSISARAMCDIGTVLEKVAGESSTASGYFGQVHPNDSTTCVDTSKFVEIISPWLMLGAGISGHGTRYWPKWTHR